MLFKFCRSLTNFQAYPGRQSSLRSKDRPPNHAVVLIAAGIERWQTVHFQLSKPDTKTRTANNSTAGREDGGKRNFRGPKRQLFSGERRFFKASTLSLVIQLHACEKWRRWGNHNYHKISWSAPKSLSNEIDRWPHKGLIGLQKFIRLTPSLASSRMPGNHIHGNGLPATFVPGRRNVCEGYWAVDEC